MDHKRCCHRGRASKPIAALRETSKTQGGHLQFRLTIHTKPPFVFERRTPGWTTRGVATEAEPPDPSRSFTKLRKPREAISQFRLLSSRYEPPIHAKIHFLRHKPYKQNLYLYLRDVLQGGPQEVLPQRPSHRGHVVLHRT